MDRASIEALLNDVAEGRTAVDEAVERLKDLPFEDLGFAKLDHHLWRRQNRRAGGRDLCPHGAGRGQRAGHARYR